MEEIRDRFFFGFYAKVVSDSSLIKSGDAELEFMVLRSRLETGQIDFVINATKRQTDPMNVGVNLLARVMKCADKQQTISLLSEIDTSLVESSVFYAICASTIYLRIGQPAEAYMQLGKHKSQEAAFFRILSLLGLHRADLAEEELEELTLDSAHTVAASLIALKKDKQAIKEALFGLLDNMERFGDSPLLGSLIANCYYATDDFEEGNEILERVLVAFPNDPSTIINTAVGLTRGTDSEKLATQISLIQTIKNGFTDELNECLKEFDEVSATLGN